jgi:hypothetical protein
MHLNYDEQSYGKVTGFSGIRNPKVRGLDA